MRLPVSGYAVVGVIRYPVPILMPQVRTRHYVLRSCPLCNSDNFERLAEYTQDVVTQESVFSFEVVEGICTNCGFIYTNPAPDDAFLADYYKTKYAFGSGTLDYDLEARTDYLKEVSGGRRTLLEVGSGEGSFLAACAEMGFDVAGLDLNKRWSADSPFSPPQNGGTYEVVVANHVLEHVLEPLSYNALKQGAPKETALETARQNFSGRWGPKPAVGPEPQGTRVL